MLSFGYSVERKARRTVGSITTHRTIHGDADPLVPLAQSSVLLAALKKTGADATLHIVKGGGHGGFRDPEVLQRVQSFFDRVLKRGE